MILFSVYYSTALCLLTFCQTDSQCCNKIQGGNTKISGTAGVYSSSSKNYDFPFASNPQGIIAFGRHQFESSNQLSSLIQDSSISFLSSQLQSSIKIEGPVGSFSVQVNFMVTKSGVFLSSYSAFFQTRSGGTNAKLSVGITFTSVSSPIGAAFLTKFSVVAENSTTALGIHVSCWFKFSNGYPYISMNNPGTTLLNYLVFSYAYFNAYNVRLDANLNLLTPFSFLYQDANISTNSYNKVILNLNSFFPTLVRGSILFGSSGFTTNFKTSNSFSLGFSIDSQNKINASVQDPAFSSLSQAVSIKKYSLTIFGLFQKTCDTPLYLSVLRDSCIELCPPGSFPNSCRLCNACNTLCLTCFESNANSCLSCDLALNRVLVVNSCVCQNGYYSANNVCSQCATPCEGCSQLASNCTSCIPLYNLVLPSRTCIFCDSALNLVFSNSACICQINSIVQSGGCIACVPGCSACAISASNCLSCFSDYNYATSARRCLFCNTTRNFTYNASSETCICLPSYNLVHQTNTCIQCAFPFVFEPTLQACICAPAYFSVQNSCLPCTAGCQSCVNTKWCKSCQESYNLVSLQYSGLVFYYCLFCNASKGAYFNHQFQYCFCYNSSSYYNEQEDQCQPCHSSCHSCLGPRFDQCLSCDQAKHKQLSSSLIGYCQCRTGFVGPLYSSRSCQSCHPSCLECQTPFQIDGCVSCAEPSMEAEFGTCQCRVGTYYFLNACQTCSQPCQICGINSCLSCSDKSYSGVTTKGLVCFFCDPLTQQYLPGKQSCTCLLYYLRHQGKCIFLGEKNVSSSDLARYSGLLYIANYTRIAFSLLFKSSLVLGANPLLYLLAINPLLLRLHLLTNGTVSPLLKVVLHGLQNQEQFGFNKGLKAAYQKITAFEQQPWVQQTNMFLADQFKSSRLFLFNIFQFVEQVLCFGSFMASYALLLLLNYLLKTCRSLKFSKFRKCMRSTRFKNRFIIFYMQASLSLIINALGHITKYYCRRYFYISINSFLSWVVITSPLVLYALLFKANNKYLQPYFKFYYGIYCKGKGQPNNYLTQAYLFLIGLKNLVIPAAFFFTQIAMLQISIVIAYNIVLVSLLWLGKSKLKFWKVQLLSSICLIFFQCSILIQLLTPGKQLSHQIGTYLSLTFLLLVFLIDIGIPVKQTVLYLSSLFIYKRKLTNIKFRSSRFKKFYLYNMSKKRIRLN